MLEESDISESAWDSLRLTTKEEEEFEDSNESLHAPPDGSKSTFGNLTFFDKKNAMSKTLTRNQFIRLTTKKET